MLLAILLLRVYFQNVDYEVRAGLSSIYMTEGWVAQDIHAESASRTLAYACMQPFLFIIGPSGICLTKVIDDDYAVSVLASLLNKTSDATFFHSRALSNSFTLFNQQSGFMEARNADGSWAGDAEGWTEGDKWAYSFDVVHNIPGLIERRGGNASFVKSLDDHFCGGTSNFHTHLCIKLLRLKHPFPFSRTQ